MAEMNPLVVLVTGASRGAGRAVAVGATVYVTGRSVDGEPTTDDVPGTIDRTPEK
jgi:NAD(P)-dependent dehydrogenase (short-subunit alcohol dehydrogenase family)